MKWYKENTFLVMSKDMKYKDSLETVGGLLEQAGLSYSKIRFYMQPEWPFSDPAEAEAHAGRLVRSFPWLKAYEVVRAVRVRNSPSVYQSFGVWGAGGSAGL